MISVVNAVLLRPQFSGNIGSAVRALANMGGERLILISPQCSIDEETRQNASGAQAWLKQITIYSSWSEFFKNEPSGFRVSLSRRQGKNRPIEELPQTLCDLFEQAPPELRGAPLYLFFGPEASGLTAEDMAWSHRISSLPIPGSFKSLNLSQAVLLGLFITQQALAQFRPQNEMKSEIKFDFNKTNLNSQEAGPPEFPDQVIRRWLEAMGFSIEKRRKSAYLVLRRLLFRNWPSRGELMVLQAILEQNIRKLRERESLFLLKKISNQLPEVRLEEIDLLGLPRDR